MIMLWISGLMVIAALAWAVTHYYLDGADLSYLDTSDAHQAAHRIGRPSPEHQKVITMIFAIMKREFSSYLFNLRQIPALRRRLNGIAEVSDSAITFTLVQAGDVAAEWVLAPASDPQRRLLYIHGGAYFAGSPRSHRPITAALARRTGASVLAVDYRLMPEHQRSAGLQDCKHAYKWLLINGPWGPTLLDSLFVAGDSAGGNLALSVIAWARDTQQPQANAVILLSPHTDACGTGPSLYRNRQTDFLLAPLLKMPRLLRLWAIWWGTRIRPCDPRISPLRGSLAGLPPTLVHASEAEMLLDDARRWVNKACTEGTDARLRTWAHLLHVWHLFDTPESREAFDDIAAFIDEQAPRITDRSDPQQVMLSQPPRRTTLPDQAPVSLSASSSDHHQS